jgi:hypothetical protein
MSCLSDGSLPFDDSVLKGVDSLRTAGLMTRRIYEEKSWSMEVNQTRAEEMIE